MAPANVLKTTEKLSTCISFSVSMYYNCENMSLTAEALLNKSCRLVSVRPAASNSVPLPNPKTNLVQVRLLRFDSLATVVQFHSHTRALLTAVRVTSADRC